MPDSLTVVVDDTDSGISYSGSWVADKGSLDNLGNFGAPMMSTTHFIKGTGSFSYTFSGTYVGVFGSSVDGSNPSRVCTVDGVTIPNNVITAPVNGILHCQVFGLADGKHTLVVTVPSPNPNGYWFDNLLYIPSASVSLANAMTMVRWDDPSISYGPQWSQTGFGNLVEVSGASMSLKFTGRVATWMGYYLDGKVSTATTATYTIDGGSPFSFDLMAIQTPLIGGDSNQRFFTTGLLSDGMHTLQVTYNGNSDSTPLAIYSFIVQNGASADMSIGGSIGASHALQAAVTGSTGGSTPSPATLASSAGGTTPPSSAAPSPAPSQSSSVVVIGTGTSAVTVTLSGTNTNSTPATTLSGQSGPISGSSTITGSSTPISSSNTSSGGATPSSNSNLGNSSSSNGPSSAVGKSHSHLGAILGAVIGVLALLLLLFLLFFLYTRKSRKRTNNDISVEPFTSPPTTFLPAMSAVPSAMDFSSSSGEKFRPFPTVQHYPDTKQPLPSETSASATRSSNASRAQQRQEVSTSDPTNERSRSPPTSSGSPAPATTAAGESEVVVLHEDSGVRIPMGAAARPGVTVVEMPPTYSAT